AALRAFTAEVARDVRDPSASRTLYDGWKDDGWTRLAPGERRRRAGRFEPELDPLGSGADFVAFQSFLGLPSLSLEFAIEGSYGTYHSAYDTHAYMERFGDPGWRYGPVLSELLGRTVMRLSSADVVPLRFAHTADKIDNYLRGLDERNADAAGSPPLPDLGLEATRTRTASLRARAEALETALDPALDGERRAPGRRAAARAALGGGRRRAASDALVAAERAFVTVEPGEPGPKSRWYRHTVYGWDVHSLYGGDTLPGLGRALRERDASAFARERARLEAALDAAI